MQNIFKIVFTLSILLFSSAAISQKFSGLDKSPHDISYYKREADGAVLIKVLYGRPQLRGRSVGKQIAPYGKLWRTGANEATEIRFYKNVMIGDSLIPAGTYSLLTIPDKKEWTFILNKDIDTWGAYSYENSNDVVRVSVPAQTDKESLDALSIAFKDGKDENSIELAIGWGKDRAFLPITINQETEQGNNPTNENKTENND